MVWHKLKIAYKLHLSASYPLNYKEVSMSDPKNNGKNSEDRIGFGIESDQGGNKKSTDQGRISSPPLRSIPLPDKPKK